MQHLGMRYGQQNIHVASHITCLWATSIDEWVDDAQLYVLIQSISVIQDYVRMILWSADQR